jgi:hypothetical protein
MVIERWWEGWRAQLGGGSGMKCVRKCVEAMARDYNAVTGNTALICPVPELPKYGVMTSTPAS